MSDIVARKIALQLYPNKLPPWINKESFFSEITIRIDSFLEGAPTHHGYLESDINHDWVNFSQAFEILTPFTSEYATISTETCDGHPPIFDRESGLRRRGNTENILLYEKETAYLKVQWDLSLKRSLGCIDVRDKSLVVIELLHKIKELLEKP